MIMSTLAQARIVPLTQRYLTLATCRYDIRDVIPAHKTSKTNICALSNIIMADPAENKYNPSLNRHELRLKYTPNSSLCDQVHNNQSGSIFGQKQSGSLDPGGFNHIGLHEINNIRQFAISHRHIQRTRYKKFFSSTSNRQSSAHKSFAQVSFFRKGLRNEAMGILSHSNHDDEQQGTSSRRTGARSLAAILGVLGLFKKTNSGEIEDERAKLSDAQKIEKMKPIELKIAKGVLSMCDQDYGRANVLFHEALHIAQDEEDEEQETMILNLIAANYFESGDYQNAEKLFIDLMRRMISNDFSPTAPAILELSLKLASIYSKNRATHDKALKGFKFVINSLLYDLDDLITNLEELDIGELDGEKRDMIALLGWSFDWFAKHLLATNDYKGAAAMMEKALEISAKVLGPLHDQTLILMNDLGTTLAMNDAPEQGKTFIKRAVEGAITSQSKELASFYVNLGLVNLKLRNLNEAIRYCEYSKELASKNPEHYNFHEVDELSSNCLTEVRRRFETEKQ